jgi:ribosomal protein S27AE
MTETRPCSLCGEHHSRKGKRRWQSYCKACHAANMREKRPKHRDLSPDARKKANTRSYTNVLVKRGHLSKDPCQRCGAGVAQAHHEDYDNPRLVMWLCRPCHMKHHAGEV